MRGQLLRNIPKTKKKIKFKIEKKMSKNVYYFITDAICGMFFPVILLMFSAAIKHGFAGTAFLYGRLFANRTNRFVSRHNSTNKSNFFFYRVMYYFFQKQYAVAWQAEKILKKPKTQTFSTTNQNLLTVEQASEE